MKSLLREAARALLDRRRAGTGIASVDQLAEQRARVCGSFAEFMRAAWSLVDPDPLIWGWHNDAIADHLQAVTAGHIKNLLINVPPGSTKTISVLIMWPAWEWICDQHPRSGAHADGRRPDLRTIAATCEDRLTLKKSLECRRLIETDWYRAMVNGRWYPRKDEWSGHLFANTAGGWRMATTVGGAAIGMHAQRLIGDDLLKPQDIARGAESGAALEAALTFWNQSLSTRRTGPETARVLIMQRLHERDVAGEMLKEQGWEALVIPQLYESKHPHRRTTVLQRSPAGDPVKTWADPRTEEGALMCPARFDVAYVEERKGSLGPQAFAAQQQQRPNPAGGSVYKREWWRFWTARPHGGVWVLSADCAFKATSTSDFVSLQVWCVLGPEFYLVDRIHERLDVLGTCTGIATLRQRWPTIGAILIEDAANGPAVAQLLKQSIPGIVLVKPLGGKEARANASARYHASGNVHLPDPALHPWVNDYIDEHLSFPLGAHDDDVDAQSQAVNYLAQNAVDFGAMLDTLRKLGTGG